MTSLMATAWLEGQRRGPVPLTVLYDPRCPLCRRLRSWLAGRATLVPVELVAAASPEARRRFPYLDHLRTITVLTVVAADGAVFEGERAWLMCAWALPSWQALAERLGSGPAQSMVRVLVRAVDGYRHRLLAVGGSGCTGCPQWWLPVAGSQPAPPWPAAAPGCRPAPPWEAAGWQPAPPWPAAASAPLSAPPWQGAGRVG
jgi:predicted DCC family thiol-disulfide oxidoreductase YuxK